MAGKAVRVSTYTGGLVGPSLPMLGPIEDGGTIVAETAPGGWGPMITPNRQLEKLGMAHHLVKEQYGL